MRRHRVARGLASRCAGRTTIPRTMRQPQRPPARVRPGNQSTDEMAHVWLQVIPTVARRNPAAASGAVMRHRLERSARATSRPMRTSRRCSRPRSPRRGDRRIPSRGRGAARRGVGQERARDGAPGDRRIDEAIAQFAAAVRLDRDFGGSMGYNWGNALLALRASAEALPGSSSALRVVPTDAAVLNDYGTVYACPAAVRRSHPLRAGTRSRSRPRGRSLQSRARARPDGSNLAASLPHYEAAVQLQKDNKDAVRSSRPSGRR